MPKRNLKPFTAVPMSRYLLLEQLERRTLLAADVCSVGWSTELEPAPQLEQAPAEVTTAPCRQGDVEMEVSLEQASLPALVDNPSLEEEGIADEDEHEADDGGLVGEGEGPGSFPPYSSAPPAEGPSSGKGEGESDSLGAVRNQIGVRDTGQTNSVLPEFLAVTPVAEAGAVVPSPTSSSPSSSGQAHNLDSGTPKIPATANENRDPSSRAEGEHLESSVKANPLRLGELSASTRAYRVVLGLEKNPVTDSIISSLAEASTSSSLREVGPNGDLTFQQLFLGADRFSAADPMGAAHESLSGQDLGDQSLLEPALLELSSLLDADPIPYRRHPMYEHSFSSQLLRLGGGMLPIELSEENLSSASEPAETPSCDGQIVQAWTARIGMYRRSELEVEAESQIQWLQPATPVAVPNEEPRAESIASWMSPWRPVLAALTTALGTIFIGLRRQRRYDEQVHASFEKLH